MSRLAGRPELDVEALVHTLEVHQAELELQNQELIAANDELRLRNAELAAARDRYRALQEVAPVPLVTLDPEGRVVDVNRAAEALLQAPREMLLTRRFALFVAEAARLEAAALLTALRAAGRAHQVELALAVEGQPAIDVVVDGVMLADREAPLTVLAMVDVSTRRRAEALRRELEHRAEESQRLESLGVLAGGIAHDFNNLLTIVLAGTDHALRTLGDNAPSAEPLHEVRRAAYHAGNLAHQMLAYSGHGSAPARAIDLVHLIRGLEPALLAAAKGVPLTVGLPEPLPWVVGDDTQLRQVVLNLTTNAAEAMHDRRGTLAITTTTATLTAAAIARMQFADNVVPGPFVVLEIRDDGTGMDAATQERIFEPYFSTKFAGRGLGLAVVRGTVRGHGGALTVESVLDRGTTIRVYLPAVSPPSAPALIAATPDAPWRGSGGVLIVDDDPHVQRVMARIVKTLGFTVVSAFGGEDALAQLTAAGAHFDLVLMDLTMPGMDGVEVATAIRAIHADLPIILVTGFGEIPPEAGSVFVAMISKPFDVQGIRQVIQRVMTTAIASRPRAAE